jgi:MFS superfamily sulfate permease-like transporter
VQRERRQGHRDVSGNSCHGDRIKTSVDLIAVMVPEGMAYAGIVGVPPIMGLYTIVLALLAYAVFGTSRQLVVGPDTATGLMKLLIISP